MKKPDHDHLTTWKNETRDIIQLDLHRQTGRPRLKITVKPGEEVKIDGEFDAAIHDVRQGMIMGGEGARLTRLGAEPTPLHSSLKSEEMKIKDSEIELGLEREARVKAEKEVARLRAQIGGKGEQSRQAPPTG